MRTVDRGLARGKEETDVGEDGSGGGSSWKPPHRVTHTPGVNITRNRGPQGSDARDAVLVACELTGASVGLGDAYVMADTRNGSATAQEARYWCAKAGSVRVKAVAFTVTSDDGQLRARRRGVHSDLS